MTPREGAQLIMAVAGSNYVRDTIETLEDYQNLKVRDTRLYVLDAATAREQRSAGRNDSRSALRPRLKRFKGQGGRWSLPFLPKTCLHTLTAEHQFGEALEAFLTLYRDQQLSFDIIANSLKDKAQIMLRRKESLPMTIRRFVVVQLHSPAHAGLIRVSLPGIFSETKVYGTPLIEDEEGLHLDSRMGGDLVQIREFGSRVFEIVGAALRA
jgi:hypothetical protein